MYICVRYVDSPGLVSEGIKWETWSEFSHVELMTMDGLGALGARAKGGVQIRHPYYETITKEERYWVEVSDAAGQKAWDWAHTQIGKPYDFENIMGIMLHRDWREDDSWICSEFVARFFEVAEKPLLRGSKTNRVTPGMTYLSTLLMDRGWKPA